MLLPALLHRWPSYGARVVFELWETADGSGHFVRMVAGGMDVTSQLACARRPHSLCTLDAFSGQFQGFMDDDANDAEV